MALRKVHNVEIVRGGFLRTHYEFRAPTRGSGYWYRRVSVKEYKHLSWLQRSRPISVLYAEGRRWWWYQGEFYHENDGYSAEEVKLLL